MHLFLAGPGHEHQLGGLMGDFVKGPIPDDLPRGIAQGLHLHRRIDTFSHTNLHTRRSRNRLDPKYGHGRGIIVDIFYDHFLASEWSNYSDVPLDEFAEKIYSILEERQATFPPRMQRSMSYMVSSRLLQSYRDIDGVRRALAGIETRLRRPSRLAESVRELELNHAAMREDFRAYLPELVAFVARQQKSPG